MKIGILGIDLPLGKQVLVDSRLEKLKSIFHSPKVTAIQLEVLGPEKIKNVDAIICEKNEKLNLILSDLEVVESQLLQKPQDELLLRIKEALEKEILISEVPLSEQEKALLLGINFLTLKPITFVEKENLTSFDQLLMEVYKNAGRITFFTANDRELRAWELKKGSTVYEASGLIHSDIQRGFIKAEVISYEDLIKAGSLNSARAKGLIRLEDKDYIVKDADIIQIRFSV